MTSFLIDTTLIIRHNSTNFYCGFLVTITNRSANKCKSPITIVSISFIRIFMINLFMQKVTPSVTLPLALIAITAFSGCATTTKPDMRPTYDKTQETLKTQRVNIVSDGCLIRIEGGRNDIMYQRSDLASLALAQTLKTRLTEKGVTINNISSPFVCGFVTKEALFKLDILRTAQAKDQPNTIYPLLSTTNTFNTATNQAYLNLYSAIKNTRQQVADAAGGYTALGLDEVSLNIIKKTEGAHKIFVVSVSGSQPSMGARLATGALTVAAVAAGGSTGYVLQKGQYYGINLINLETNQTEWVKSGDIKGNVFKMPVDNSYTLPKMLDPLYVEQK